MAPGGPESPWKEGNRYPLPAKAKPVVLLRAAGSGQREAGNAPGNGVALVRSCVDGVDKPG